MPALNHSQFRNFPGHIIVREIVCWYQPSISQLDLVIKTIHILYPAHQSVIDTMIRDCFTLLLSLCLWICSQKTVILCHQGWMNFYWCSSNQYWFIQPYIKAFLRTVHRNSRHVNLILHESKYSLFKIQGHGLILTFIISALF